MSLYKYERVNALIHSLHQVRTSIYMFQTRRTDALKTVAELVEEGEMCEDSGSLLTVHFPDLYDLGPELLSEEENHTHELATPLVTQIVSFLDLPL